MPYTVAWEDVFKLLGTRDADEIDDSTLNSRAGLEERLEDILYDVNGFPWKIKVPGVAVDGTVNTRVTPPMGILFNSLNFDINAFSVQPTAIGVGGVWVSGIPIARGSTIKGVSFSVVRATAGATVTCKLVKVDNVGVPTVISSQGAIVQAGTQSVNLGAMTEQITTLADYYLVCEIAADGATVINSVLRAVDLAYLVAGAP